MAVKKYKVRIRAGFNHHKLPADYAEGGIPKGEPGPLAVEDDEIEVTEAEYEAFGDKFELLEPAPRKRGRPRRVKAEAEEDEPQED